MNWDDLRILAAVREAGTYAGAGMRLRIDETTVARRVARIQRALGLRLFEAADGVRTPTPHCETILAHVDAIAGHVTAIDRVRATAPGPTGRLRIASTPVVAEEILAPRAGRLLAAHPGLTLQLLTSPENVKFSRWEADLAIRLRKPPKGDFSIAKLAAIRFYLFEPATAHSDDAIVCAYPPSLDDLPESRFLAAKGLQQRARCVTDNARVIRALVRTRRAAGIVPAYLAGDLLADRRLRATLLPERREAWLLVQPHLKRDAAARLVIDWVREAFQELADA